MQQKLNKTFLEGGAERQFAFPLEVILLPVLSLNNQLTLSKQLHSTQSIEVLLLYILENLDLPCLVNLFSRKIPDNIYQFN